MGSGPLFENRVKDVMDVFIEYARNQDVIKYPVIYGLFHKEKVNLSDAEWQNCIWNTVEEASNKVASREGAIYDSLLSNRRGIPEDFFYEVFVAHRSDLFKRDTGICLPSLHGMGKQQKFNALTYPVMKKMTEYERARVYKHVKLYY